MQVPLRQHYVSLSPLGALVVGGHRGYQRLRAWAKGSDRVKAMRRMLAQVRDRLAGEKASDQL